MNNQHGRQPQQQNPPSPTYIPSQRPYTDFAAEKKRKADAINALGDKISAVMRTNPVLAVIERNADIISYIITGVSALLTILSMSLNYFDIVFGYISLIFGFFALSKKSALPLAVSLSVLSLFKLVCFIGSIANFAVPDRNAFFPVGFVISFVFSIFELTAIGYITFIVWTYFAAAIPERPRPRPYYGQPPIQPVQPPPQQNEKPKSAPAAESAAPSVPADDAEEIQAEEEINSTPLSVSETTFEAAREPETAPAADSEDRPAAVPGQPSISAPVNTPILKPLVSAFAEDRAEPSSASVKQKFCTACGTANIIEAAFCKQCGRKF